MWPTNEQGVGGGGAIVKSDTQIYEDEKQAVLEAASHAPGIASVRDELRIDPSLLAEARGALRTL
jgi:hypothetical protein